MLYSYKTSYSIAQTLMVLHAGVIAKHYKYSVRFYIQQTFIVDRSAIKPHALSQARMILLLLNYSCKACLYMLKCPERRAE